MDMMKIYREVEKRLDRVDFSALYRGFSRYPFALYDEKQAVIGGETVNRPAEFLANTAVKYNGEYIAIWQLREEPGDLDILAAKIAHEMLHAHQQTAGDTRWADERAALVKYRYEESNFAARLEEAACMEKCLKGEAPEAFKRLLSLRKARMVRFPFQYDYEARTEQMEGSAHYVELSALAQLDADKARRRWEQTLAELSDPVKYFPVRAVTYLSGAAFLACLKKYTDFDTDALTDTPFSVAAIQDAEPCALPEGDERAAACLNDWRRRFREKVQNALDKGEVVLEGKHRLVGWNVYDGAWDGKYAVLTYFLGYYDGETLPGTDAELFANMRMLHGDFVAEMDESFVLSRVWKQ